MQWNYMHHRKRGILSRLPHDWQIIYVEPFRLGTKWSWYEDKNVKVRSIFCYKKGLDKLFDFVVVRRLAAAINYIFIKLFVLRPYAGRADVAIVSNYGVFHPRRFRKFAPKLVVDINDIPAGFGMPDWVENNFNETVRAADKVIVSSKEWQRYRPDAVYIGNGVDFEAFNIHRRNL